jgi:hypothetical protein
MKTRIAWAVMLAALAGCGGGGGGAGDEPRLPSGQLDPAYGTAGKFEAPLLGPARTLVARDGSAYLVLGNTVRKLDSSGAGVMSYGEGGIARFEPGSGTYAAVNDRGEVFASFQSGVDKVDSAGRPDLAFGVNGRATVGLEEMGLSHPIGLAIDGADNVYLFCLKINATDVRAILKVDRQGRLDTSYGLAGVVLVGAGPITIDARGFAYITDAIPEPRSGEIRVAVTKLDSNGRTAADYTRALGQLCASPSFTAPVVDGGGNILVGGSCAVGDSRQAMLFKVDSRGAPVVSFRDGLRPGIFGEAADEQPGISGLAVAANGDIFVAGTRVNDASRCSIGTVAKLDSAGNAVTTFGRSGVVDLAPLPRSVAADVALDGAARLYASVWATSVCQTRPGIQFAYYLYRLGS